MPQMGVSVSEGTITKWLKQEGEEIQADEPLLEISTDKVDTEVPSPGSGVVQQILHQEGETVPVGERIAVIGAPGAAPAEQEQPSGDGAAPAEEQQQAQPEPATAQAAAEAEAASGAESPAPTGAEPVAAGAGTDARDANGDGKSFISPVVARIAGEHGVDISKIQGTGRGGRVTKKDILGFIESGQEAQAQAPAPAPAQAAAPTEPQPQQEAAAAAPA